jgi:hypothetical protein
MLRAPSLAQRIDATGKPDLVDGPGLPDSGIAVVSSRSHRSRAGAQRLPISSKRALKYLASCLGFVLAASWAVSLAAQVSVLTSHNDNTRTGLNASEAILTPVNVNSNGFGRIFAQPVDGPIYAQPLLVPNVAVPGNGTHNAVIVATQHDSVYAFDADSNAGSNSTPLWHASFINPAAGITAVPSGDAAYPSGDCQTFLGEIGIVGTPVIDPSSDTLFVVARTKEPAAPPSDLTLVQRQRLHALDITTGAERPQSPVVIDASVPGTGDGSSGGLVPFNPAREMQRPALLLSGGVVYIAWASYCDINPYHGWIIGYDAQTLQQVSVFNATPNGSAGGIWMAGAGPAAAADGSIYCVTGNGTFDTNANPRDFGDSFVKLTSGLALSDFFTPHNQASLEAQDADLGSGGALLLPYSVGSPAHPRLVVGGGKEGKIYLLDRDNLGRFNPVSDVGVLQTLPLSSPLFGLPAYFNYRLYFQGVGGPLQAFVISNAQMTGPVSQSTDQAVFRGATPSISANGATNGIAWQVAASPAGAWRATLRAYDAADLSHRLYDSYSSTLVGAPDGISYVKFVVPTIANGKVYVGTIESLAVFGLRSIIWSITWDRASAAVQVLFSGPTDMNNVLQASEDFIQWTDLGPGTPTGSGTFRYIDPVNRSHPARFYRVRSG